MGPDVLYVIVFIIEFNIMVFDDLFELKQILNSSNDFTWHRMCCFVPVVKVSRVNIHYAKTIAIFYDINVRILFGEM